MIDDTVSKVSEAVARSSASSSAGFTSVRLIGGEVGLSKTTVHKIMRSNFYLFPYNLQLMQSLEDSDKPQRLAFTE